MSDIKKELPGAIGAFQGAIRDILADEDSQVDRRIPVICENQMDLVNRIQQSVARAAPGICIVIRSPRIRDTRGSAMLWFDDVAVVFRIIENVTINRSEGGTKVPAQLVAEQIVRTINNAIPEGSGSALVPVSIQEINDVRSPGILMYEVTATTGLGLGETQGEEE